MRRCEAKVIFGMLSHPLLRLFLLPKFLEGDNVLGLFLIEQPVDLLFDVSHPVLIDPCPLFHQLRLVLA